MDLRPLREKSPDRKGGGETLYRLTKWIDPFDVVKSIKGPPDPIRPSSDFRSSSWPACTTSNSDDTFEWLVVRARTSAFAFAGK